MNAPDTHAAPYLGLAALLRLNFSGADLGALGQTLIQRAVAHPEDAAALMDAAVISQFRRDHDTSALLQSEALRQQRLYCLPSRQPTRLRLLALVAPGEIMANVPVECLLEDADVELYLYYASAEEFDPADIPEHDVLFIAIGESSANRAILQAWLPLLAEWPRPVLNDPLRILDLARDSASGLLQGMPGVSMPPTLRLPRSMLGQLASGDRLAGLCFPLIVRPLDSHAGKDLYKFESAAELAAVLHELPGDAFFVSAFIDYRSAEGQYRKYRIILVDGQPYPCHMGISSHWMIHYLNAGMEHSADKRAEEAQFLLDAEDGFTARHGDALRAIAQRAGMDYLGVDCAETPRGELLVFEIDHAMVVHAMDSVELFPYKQAPMQRIFDAFRAMLSKACGHAAG